VNRGDRHHAWATHHLLAARQRGTKVTVPDLVIGEAFTTLRYDRRVSPRKDASIVLTIFKLVEGSPELFDVQPVGHGTYRRAKDVLAQYLDLSFSYVDADIFSMVDDDPSVDRVLTVDGRDFSTYRFGQAVEIGVP